MRYAALHSAGLGSRQTVAPANRIRRGAANELVKLRDDPAVVLAVHRLICIRLAATVAGRRPFRAQQWYRVRQRPLVTESSIKCSGMRSLSCPSCPAHRCGWQRAGIAAWGIPGGDFGDGLATCFLFGTGRRRATRSQGVAASGAKVYRGALGLGHRPSTRLLRVPLCTALHRGFQHRCTALRPQSGSGTVTGSCMCISCCDYLVPAMLGR